MTLTDSHQPKIAGASTKPAVFVDGGSGTTGLGIAERLRLQNDVVVKNIAEEKRKGVRTFYFLTEHGRTGTLSNELGTTRSFEKLTTMDLNNKFLLVRATFD